MKLLKLFLLCSLLIPILSCAAPKKAVTFGWGGRLGDNILDYTHAKWISYKWGIPLLFQPFQYSDHFAFHDHEAMLTPELSASYSIVILESFSQLDEAVETDTLYFVAHTPDSYIEYLSLGCPNLYIPVDWTDETFAL